ncbi:hypothetical protein ACFQPF_09760 [Fictibacillus iocasae]|uniref:Uncharacterized protein n=1 Tax=Fictibacillus iocasae TaxID=2715437 RepID=A0ABW2NMU6_9BACL
MMKHYSWGSYVSFGLPILLFCLLFAVPSFTEESVFKVIVYTLYIGSPLSLIVSVYALAKKNEKKMMSVFGLLSSLLLTGSLVYFILLGLGMGEA